MGNQNDYHNEFDNLRLKSRQTGNSERVGQQFAKMLEVDMFKNIELKQNEKREPSITEISPGRFRIDSGESIIETGTGGVKLFQEVMEREAMKNMLKAESQQSVKSKSSKGKFASNRTPPKKKRK